MAEEMFLVCEDGAPLAILTDRVMLNRLQVGDIDLEMAIGHNRLMAIATDDRWAEVIPLSVKTVDITVPNQIPRCAPVRGGAETCDFFAAIKAAPNFEALKSPYRLFVKVMANNHSLWQQVVNGGFQLFLAGQRLNEARPTT